jgi:hypothetical protein
MTTCWIIEENVFHTKVREMKKDASWIALASAANSLGSQGLEKEQHRFAG